MYQSTLIAASACFYFVTSEYEMCAFTSWGLRGLDSFKGYKNLKAVCDHYNLFVIFVAILGDLL